MELRRITKVAAGELSIFRERLPDEDWLDMSKATTDWFLASDNGQLIALIGLILPSLVDSSAYLWMIRTLEPLNPAQVLGGMRLAKKFLREMPWTMLAECSEGVLRNEKFLIACGFHHVTNLHDRQLFQWSA